MTTRAAAGERPAARPHAAAAARAAQRTPAFGAALRARVCRPRVLSERASSARARGRCVFEFSASGELIVRLSAYPKMQKALEALPPKVLELSSTEPIREVELPASDLETRVEEVTRRIERATFTGRGDRPMVIQL